MQDLALTLTMTLTMNLTMTLTMNLTLTLSWSRQLVPSELSCADRDACPLSASMGFEAVDLLHHTGPNERVPNWIAARQIPKYRERTDGTGIMMLRSYNGLLGITHL